MGEVRILVQGTTKDPEAFSAFMKSETDVLSESEPGTLLMEVFVDRSNGAVVGHERYADADAFDERVAAAAAQFGAIQAAPVAGFAR